MQTNAYFITFLVYITIIFIIGLLATRKTKSLADYVLGGRSLSGPVAALGAGTSDMSSWLLMALPGAIYEFGLNQIWLPIALSLGAWANWRFVGKRLRVFSEVSGDALTIPSYLNKRFADNTRILRTITSVVIIFFFTAYSTAGFISGAKLAQITFGLEYNWSLLISASVIILYTCLGGFLAVSWIDFFQGILMFLALLIVPIVTSYYIDFQTIEPNFYNPFTGISWLMAVSLLAWGLGYFGQPHILARFMAIKNPRDVSIAMWICMIWMVLALVGAVLTGLFGAIFYINNPLSKPETVFLQLSQVLFNPWITGILIAAVLSAIMSTISAQLLASSSSIIEDFYHAYIRKKATDAEYLFIGRLAVLIISIIALLFALDPNSKIMNVVEYAWAGLGASFGPVILISLYWRKMTRIAAIYGMLGGSITVIISHYLISGLNPILPGFIINLIIIWLFSYKSSNAAKSAKIFDQCVAKLSAL